MRIFLLLLITTLCAGACTYDPKCKDRPNGLFANPIDLIERNGVLYVSNANNRNDSCYNFITRIDKDAALDENSNLSPPRDFIEVDAFPGPLASDPNGRYLYTVSRETDQLQIIDPEIKEIVNRIDVGSDSYNITYLDDWAEDNLPGLIIGSLDETFLRLYDLSDPIQPAHFDLDDDAENGITGIYLESGDRKPQRLETDPAGGRGWVGYQQSYTDYAAMEITWKDGEFETRAFTTKGSDLESAATDAIAYDPNTNVLWVAAQVITSADEYEFLSYGLLRFDVTNATLIDIIPLADSASIRSMVAHNGRIYAAVYGLDQVWTFDAENGEILDKFGVGDGPTRILADEENDRLYVLNYISGSIMVINPNPDNGSNSRIVRTLK